VIPFGVLLALTGLTRLIELNISKRHRRELIQNGATASDERGFAGMVLLHVGILAGALVEAVVFARFVPTWLSVFAAAFVVAASALRVWAIRSLGQHWNVRVIDSTSLGVIQSGPYRYIRHPNYVAVLLELAFLPLLAGAWLTAALGTGLHLVVLRQRIRHEESVLNQSAEYRSVMAGKPRFVPHMHLIVGRGEPRRAPWTRQA
jgi:methyltransferase